eukprot:XP_017171791.1 PREDICTED: uncharacterized protein Gm16867 isoform X5 [Mus musculus]
MCSGQRRHTERWVPSARRTNSAATAGLFFSSYWCFWPLGSTPARHGVSRRNPGEEVPTLRSEVFLPLPLLPTSCRLPRPAGPRMELRRGGVGNQAAGRRMDGDCRDGGCGSKDAGSEDYENLPTSASVSTHMTAGAMAGILEHSIMYPVDSVKGHCSASLNLKFINSARMVGPTASWMGLSSLPNAQLVVGTEVL